MIYLGEVNDEIKRLENLENHSASVISMLSSLYTIRDHLEHATLPDQMLYSYAAPPREEAVGLYGDSDFLEAVARKNPEAVWRVMDELMESLQLVNAKAYDSVLRKLMALPPQ